MKNDNIKNEWKKYSFVQKISFVLTVIIISLLILGSLGGLVYLFKPKKVSADEYISGTTEGSLISSAIVSVPLQFSVENFYVNYPDSYGEYADIELSYPLIFSTVDGSSLTLSAFKTGPDANYFDYSLSVSVGYGIIVPCYSVNIDENAQFYLSCTSSNLINNIFSDLYSVELYYLWGMNELAYFLLTDINGSTVEYSFYPYRAETFGEFELNDLVQFSGRWLYIANSNVNFTERLNQAKEESYNNGYNQGYTEGKDYGYNIGYNQGVNDTDKFTFSSLLNAIFYAPLKAFISIFNFEILGVNVLNIISFLFTMLIAIGIIRWVV